MLTQSNELYFLLDTYSYSYSYSSSLLSLVAVVVIIFLRTIEVYMRSCCSSVIYVCDYLLVAVCSCCVAFPQANKVA